MLSMAQDAQDAQDAQKPDSCTLSLAERHQSLHRDFSMLWCGSTSFKGAVKVLHLI